METTPRPFRFGVINEQMLPRAAWFDQVRRVEALGYATFLIRDHFTPDFFGDQLGPLVALTAAAMATTTLRVGTLVIGNDYRHPVVLAKEMATLDTLSGGRVELGIGAGWQRSEYTQAGMPYETAGVRIDRLEEALAVIRGLFGATPLTFRGRHYHIDALAGVPTPVQRPFPPILIGAGHRRMLTLAGREADIVGLLTTSVASGAVEDDPAGRTPAGLERKIGWVREGAGARFEQIELSMIPHVRITDDRERSAAALIAERGWDGVPVADVLAMPSMLIGTPDEIAAALCARRARFGVSYYVVSDAVAERFAPVVARLAGT